MNQKLLLIIFIIRSFIQGSSCILHNHIINQIFSYQVITKVLYYNFLCVTVSSCPLLWKFSHCFDARVTFFKFTHYHNTAILNQYTSFLIKMHTIYFSLRRKKISRLVRHSWSRIALTSSLSPCHIWTIEVIRCEY